jgi:hypothetical protein
MRRVGLEAVTSFAWMMILWWVMQIIPHLMRFALVSSLFSSIMRIRNSCIISRGTK